MTLIADVPHSGGTNNSEKQIFIARKTRIRSVPGSCMPQSVLSTRLRDGADHQHGVHVGGEQGDAPVQVRACDTPRLADFADGVPLVTLWPSVTRISLIWA